MTAGRRAGSETEKLEVRKPHHLKTCGMFTNTTMLVLVAQAQLVLHTAEHDEEEPSKHDGSLRSGKPSTSHTVTSQSAGEHQDSE